MYVSFGLDSGLWSCADMGTSDTRSFLPASALLASVVADRIDIPHLPHDLIDRISDTPKLSLSPLPLVYNAFFRQPTGIPSHFSIPSC
jgi:hypothetical protein